MRAVIGFRLVCSLDLWTKVALTETEPKLRRMAVAKLTDQEVLAVVARTDAD
jgi:hypothetical protein